MDYNSVLQRLKDYFDVMPDKASESEVIENIKAGVTFRGANLWILIFAIFTASLGLNVNSTAVIIGAMLISPLMGPIIGIGLSFGIGDMDLLKKSLKNYAVATVIGVITATVYFWISPLSEAQSELLARTSPTLYDVLIALFGGAAGIVAQCTNSKNSNVIPGVAIATALMPPLCTAGYGIAIGNFSYFIGAFYLFFINTVFISLATYLGSRLFRFHRVHYIDGGHMEKIRRYVYIALFLIIVPAGFMTVSIVRESYRESNMNRFVKEELTIPGTQVLSSKLDADNKTIQVVSIGEEINKTVKNLVESRVDKYGLKGYRLEIIQGSGSDSLVNAGMKRSTSEYNSQIMAQNAKILSVEKELQEYTRYERLGKDISSEIRMLFPQVSGISIAKMYASRADTLSSGYRVNAIVRLSEEMTGEETAKMQEWLRARCKSGNLYVIIDKQ